MAEPSAQETEPDLSGKVLDRYRLVRCLGMGGMGAVYEAEHTALGKRVAVKVLRQQFSSHELSRKRFLREARAATRVEHPHVVDISDFGETPDGRVYFVMELLTGRELGQLLEAEGPLPWPRARELLLQIVSALGAAHEKGVVHRDVKPSNCFLVSMPGLQGRDFVKVLDFGIAKLAGKPGEEVPVLTSTDEVFGTVAYMAPEMAMGVGNDPRSDVYAVGVMMYRMLVGALPFEGGTAFQILARHVTEPPVPPRAREPSIPEGVERIILKALAKLPEERFASMPQLAEALERGDVAPATEVTMHMSAGGSCESLKVERTAVLPSRGIQTGPWATVGSTSGGTEVITDRVAALSQGISRLSRSMQLAAVAEPIVEEDERELEEDERAREEDERKSVEAARGARAREGQARSFLLGGIALAMVVALGAIAWVLALREGAAPEPVVVAGTTAPREREPEREVEPVEPEPSRRNLAPRKEADVLETVEVTGEATSPSEPLPRADQPLLRSTDSGAASPKPGKRRPPKSDAAVAAGARSKLLERCRVDGSTRVTIEGMIGTGGKVLSPIVSPQGFDKCVKSVMKSVAFAPGEELRPLPEIAVEL